MKKLDRRMAKLEGVVLIWAKCDMATVGEHQFACVCVGEDFGNELFSTPSRTAYFGT